MGIGIAAGENGGVEKEVEGAIATASMMAMAAGLLGQGNG